MTFLFFLIRVLGYFLPKGLAELTTRGIARLFYYSVYRKGASNHFSNLKAVFGDEIEEKKLREISKRAEYNLAIALYEHSIMDRLNSRNYAKYLKAENIENLFQAYREGNGVVILSAHLGNYEWGAALMAFKGLPVAVMSIEYKTEFIKKLYEVNRRKVGINVFYVRRSFSGLIRFLKKGGVLAIAADRKFGESNMPVELFKRKIEIPKGAFFLASHLDASIVPAFSLKEQDRLYHVYFEKPYKITGDQIEYGAKRYAKILEKYVKRYPEQWLVFDKIWD